DAIRAINRAGTTAVYTSHYMEEVQALCDRIAIIDHGRVLLQGALADLLREASGGAEVEVRLAAPLEPAQRRELERDGNRIENDRLWLTGGLYAAAHRLEALQVQVAGLHRGS